MQTPVPDHRELIQDAWGGTQEPTGSTSFPGNSAAGGLAPSPELGVSEQKLK